LTLGDPALEHTGNTGKKAHHDKNADEVAKEIIGKDQCSPDCRTFDYQG
jgi:hypothetical protein